jgi:hypothetical protein
MVLSKVKMFFLLLGVGTFGVLTMNNMNLANIIHLIHNPYGFWQIFVGILSHYILVMAFLLFIKINTTHKVLLALSALQIFIYVAHTLLIGICHSSTKEWTVCDYLQITHIIYSLLLLVSLLGAVVIFLIKNGVATLNEKY